MLRFLTILMVASALFGQSTTKPDAAQYIKYAGGTKTTGYCLTWNSSGLVTQATCGAGGGETNAGANLGAGSVVYTGKSGVNLQFRSFTVGSNKLSVTQNTNDIAYDLIPANNLLSSFGGSLNLSQIAQGGATTGQLLQWNGTAWVPASTGGGGGPANTDALAEGSTNLYSTTGRIRAALSVTGILSYNNGTGVFSCSNCADITSSYANPSWISSLAWAKLTGVPGYQLTSEKASASGYASLDASTLVPRAQLGTGTPNSTNFLRGDGTWTNPAGSVNTLLAGVSIGTRPGMNFIAGSGFTWSIADDAGNNRVNVTGTPDTSILLSKVTAQDGGPFFATETSASGTTYTGTMNPTLTAYGSGKVYRWKFLTNCVAGAITMNIDALGVRSLKLYDGTTNPTAADCAAGTVRELRDDGTLLRLDGGPAGISGTVTVPQGGTGITSGTSGGIPYFSASNTIASSGALSANLPVFGGGAGAAPIVGTRTGNTTLVATSTGAQTSGRCVEIDASGNHIAAAAACGTGGGSTTQDIPIFLGAPLASVGYPPCLMLNGAVAVTSWYGGVQLPNASTPDCAMQFMMPSNWRSAQSITVSLIFADQTAVSGDVRMQASIQCFANNTTAWNQAQTYTTTSSATLAASNGVMGGGDITAVTASGCSAKSIAFLRVRRDAADAADTYTGTLFLGHIVITLGVQ